MTDQIEALMRDGNLEEAQVRCEALLQLQPAIPRLHALLGLCHFRAHRFAKALAPLKTAASLDPGNIDYGIKLAQTYQRLHNYHEAAVVAHDYLKLAPGNHTLQALDTLLQDHRILDKAGWEKGERILHHAVVLSRPDAAKQASNPGEPPANPSGFGPVPRPNEA